MHELSIAQEILSIVNQYIPAGKEKDVQLVRVKIGKLSNILPESLQFCFEVIIKETGMPDARMEIIHIPAKIECIDCKSILEVDDIFIYCARCESYNVKIISGDELYVSEIILNDGRKN